MEKKKQAKKGEYLFFLFEESRLKNKYVFIYHTYILHIHMEVEIGLQKGRKKSKESGGKNSDKEEGR